jgi:hypothetical protein
MKERNHLKLQCAQQGLLPAAPVHGGPGFAKKEWTDLNLMIVQEHVLTSTIRRLYAANRQGGDALRLRCGGDGERRMKATRGKPLRSGC